VIVIDASSLAKYVLREEGWENVKRYLSNEACSLTLALAEVSNAIWKHNVLYKRISRKEAEIMFNALEKMKDVVDFEPIEKHLQDAIEIALKEEIPVYDALYLAQAVKHELLVTSDRRQGEIAGKIGVNVEVV